jgi:hypothetical protein
MFPEALMLHYLDDLDSKMESMRAQFQREAELDSAWTSYNPSLARPLLNTKKFLEKGLAGARTVEPAKPEPVAASSSEQSPAGAAVDEPSDRPASAAVEDPTPVSPLAALERKFASHKVTPVDPKPH